MTIRDLEALPLDPSKGKEYISNIHTALTDPGIGPLALLGFLERVVSGFLPEGRRICSSGAGMTPEDRDELTMYGWLF